MDGVASELCVKSIAEYLYEQENKSLLRFLTCGSVDDGKSTLIGRLLYDTKLIFEDQIAALERDSKKHGTVGGDIDFALLVDGLEAEREQGITIDVAYRFFATDRRKFIVADTPGHEEYTRNMATGASTSDLAIVLVDARQGVLRQTRRHSYIASLLGIRHIVLAVNKIDLVGYDQTVFDRIVGDFHGFAGDLGFVTIHPIPLSARYGDNVTCHSGTTPWYQGPHLLEYLEGVSLEEAHLDKPFRFPVQYVSRPNLDFRGFAGQIAAGSVRVGDEVVVAKSGQSTKVKKIVTVNGTPGHASEGEAVTLLLEDQIDVSRGDMLVASDDRPIVAEQFQAHVIWFASSPMIPGRSYIIRTETDSADVTVTALKYEVDINTFAHLAAKTLAMNGIAVCNLSTRAPLVFDSYADNRVTGNFILIDRMTNTTVGAGMIDFPLRRANNIHLHAIQVNQEARASLKEQKPIVIWFTGLSGSGKSTIADHLEKLLHARGRHTYLLDGDNVRHGLNRDLGFTDEDRVENIRRVAEVAKLMADAGLIVLVSSISPFKSERTLARELMGTGGFIEVFVDTSFEECARRDPKGLYKKAMRGDLTNFTGVSSPYEVPESPDVHLRTEHTTAAALAAELAEHIELRSMR
ncbi:sulfate adenylyltransferase subunit CysN [Agrobacterium vitis]|uniref:Multifunctional fusion protein n=1 Tax=Agrobacterium vitis TaxID=373 RepID=A0A6L6VP90_AGRVI|nr:sulfate adenylyltransferase subunit CysN [Agrobacterium vitis]MUZ75262.1 sulfate adenylyltransferase subunit CysN [Agrobacterium vitis]